MTELATAAAAPMAEKPSGPSTLTSTILRYDLPASLVVFLVALPLSLGIAVASDAPPLAGLIAAIVGGLVAGALGGSPLQVSGPAAGLTVIVAGLIAEFGWKVTCAITVCAGVLQILFGLSRVGRAALAISPMVVHAMLAGIGITIALQQVHVLLGGETHSSAWHNVVDLPLHLAVELGLPVAVLLCSAIVWLIWRARPWQETDPSRQLAWGVLALIALHSMLEYPLWYGPFQMAVGLCIGLLWRRSSAASALTASSGGTQALRVCSVFVLLGVAYAAWDYRRVSQIYLAPEHRATAYRDHTLEKIQGSWLFRDQVRFAELTLTPLTPQNASQLNAMAHEMLHFSPESRVVEKLIDSALLLGRDDEAQAFMRRYQAAYPQAYAAWAGARKP